MPTVEMRSLIEDAPICRVRGFVWKPLEEQIQCWIYGLALTVNIEVVGAAHGMLIRVWTGQTKDIRYVHAEDYVNHRDPWARRNPSLAAVITGLTEILTELGLR